MVTFEFIRHGETEGNLSHRYIGRSDQDLCPEGMLSAARLYAVTDQADVWLLSPMRRCLETACLTAGVPAASVEALIRDGAPAGEFVRLLALECPDSMIRIVDDLRECDFGDFENLNWEELQGNPDYQSWIDSGGNETFPNGERPEAFRMRCREAFENQVRALFNKSAAEGMTPVSSAETPGAAADRRTDLTIRLVVHGGTIMSIMDALAEQQTPPKNYYDWHIENGEILKAAWDGRWPLMLLPEEKE